MTGANVYKEFRSYFEKCYGMVAAYINDYETL
jgi:hypothetical protein